MTAHDPPAVNEETHVHDAPNDLDTLAEIEHRVLWLAARSVHDAASHSLAWFGSARRLVPASTRWVSIDSANPALSPTSIS